MNSGNTSFKERLNQDLQNRPEPFNDRNTHQNTREHATAASILFTASQSRRSFPYSYMLNVGMDNKSGVIEINFTSGKVLIKGRNLDPLFYDLHRHKVTDVNIASKGIDDIIIKIRED